MSVNQHVSHGKILRQTYQSVVHGRVSVGMITTQHSADRGGALFVGALRVESVLEHRIQNTPVHRLQTVAHVWQRSLYDDRHRVCEKGILHLVVDIDLYDLLILMTFVFHWL